MTGLLDSALMLAFVGLPVFPLKLDKRPACEGGLHAASADPNEVARLFANPTAALIGVPMGPPSGLDAIDIDPKREGLAWLEANEHRLPATRRHHSRSGGLHILLKHTPGMRTKFDRIAPGVEVRGDGGYIVWWPAHGLFASGDVTAEWPEWLLLDAVRGQRPAGPPPVDPADLAPPSPAALIVLLQTMPNPADTTRGDYVALNLAVQGCIRGLEALGLAEGADVDAIQDAAADWCSRWDSDRAGSYEDERERWESDWSTRENDAAGWRHVLDLADRLGVDTGEHRLAAAVAEFGAPLPPEEGEPTARPAAPTVDSRGSLAIDTPRRPVIRIQPDNLTTQINEAEAALLSADLGLYQRAGQLVRVGEVTERLKAGGRRTLFRAVEVDESHLRELIGRAADFTRHDAREKADVVARCPADIPRGYLARKSLEWRVPHLAGIVTAPTLRWDGSVLQVPGYDEATGLLFDPRGEAFPPVPDEPTRADAVAAIATLRDLLAEFPFVAEPDRAVALSAILSALVRRSLPAAPMHALTAPAPGTGKSYLLDIVARIATGGPAAGLDYSADEAENRKAIDAALLAGFPLLVLDNITAEVQGARLNQIITQERVTVRVLGESRTVDVPCDALVLANGNNLVVAADMTRRTLLARLDAATERPEAREFRQDPAALVTANRGAYAVAALTVMRAYYVAGRPDQPKPLGSFEAWSGLVRGALVWVGEADPVATMDEVRASDPRRADQLAVMEPWAAALGDRSATVHEVIAAAAVNGDLRDALIVVAGVGGAVNPRRLGNWLRLHRGRLVNGLKLVPGPMRAGVLTWGIHGLPPAARSGVYDLAAERSRRAAATIDQLAGLQ